MNIAGYIEHTNLQAVATAADIASLTKRNNMDFSGFAFILRI